VLVEGRSASFFKVAKPDRCVVCEGQGMRMGRGSEWPQVLLRERSSLQQVSLFTAMGLNIAVIGKK